MIRLQTYAAFGLLATASAVYYAFSSREQFYPATVYLSTSKICFVLLLNTGLVAMLGAWQLARRLFLGPLREAEVERLNEQAWREVVEILFAVTIFRQDFSVSFLAMVAALLLVKALHWLAQKRVEYIETTPSVPLLSHVRIVSFMAFLLVVDCLFLSNSLRPLIQKWEASVAIFFSFEYMILATSTVSTFVKYVFYVSDMLMEGQWERKAVYTFYLELISDLVHLSLYMLFFIAIFLNYGVPLHLIRELYETFRNFRIRIADYVRYRKITSNMNERFPEATAEELNASDATCIICREEMTTAKKLLCGHLFHVHCLRSWLERQHTCPTCRAPIIPPDNGRSASARQHGGQPGVQPAAGIDAPASDGAPGDNMNRRQAKLEAAAAAASLYGRSFVYPPANTLNRSGPQSTSNTPQSEASNSNQSQKDQELQIQNSSDGSAPLPSSAHGAIGSGPSTGNLENSLQKAQENFIKSQIKMLQIQLQMIQRGAAVSVTNNENDEHRRNFQMKLMSSDKGIASESTTHNFAMESMEGNISVSSSPEELLEQALQYLGTGCRDQALPLIRTAVERNPYLSMALIGMGQTLFSNRLFLEAAVCFEHAIPKIQEDDPLLVLAYFGAGLSNERQGDNETAIKLLQRIAELKEPEKPINKTCYFQGMLILGSILCREGRNSEAAKYVRMAIAYDPSAERFLKECEEGMDDQPKPEEK